VTIPDAVRPRKPRRETLGIAAGLLLLLAVVAFAWVALQAATDAQHRAEATQSADAVAIKQLSDGLTQTRAQLVQHGVVPKAPPPQTIVQGIPGAAGQSIVGPAGPAGQNGTSPDPAAIAQLVLAMIHPSPGPAGAVGPAGPAGAAGKDSTVPGPQGPAGAAGAQGSPGQDGSPGATGAQGATGPAPSGWTFTAADGTVYDCAPDTAGSTHYSCTARPASPPPSPSPSPSQSATAQTKTAAKRPTTPVSTGPGRP
jgi:hypothetical protein